MTTFNGVTVISRGNRPTPLIPAKLDFYNYVAGTLSDPFQVCSVHIFPNTTFGTADDYVNKTAGDPNYGLVDSGATNMVFHNYLLDEFTGEAIGFDGSIGGMASPVSFTGDLRYAASSIFNYPDNVPGALPEPGHFSVILQPSGVYYQTSAAPEFTTSLNNTASSTGGYIDIWTVVQTEGSRAQIYVNQFDMQTANVFAASQPLEVTTSNKLVQRYIEAGSRKRLQIKTAIVVDNEPMEQSLRNLIETGSLLSNPQISITKLNESPTLTSRVAITGFNSVGGFISSGVSLDTHGTISFVWDTTNIQPFYDGENLGGPLGVYEITVKYDIVDETIISDRFKLIVR